MTELEELSKERRLHNRNASVWVWFIPWIEAFVLNNCLWKCQQIIVTHVVRVHCTVDCFDR